MTEIVKDGMAKESFTLSGLVRGQKRKVKVAVGAQIKSQYEGLRTTLVIKTINPKTNRTATTTVSVESNYYRVWIAERLTPSSAQNQN